jgi:hypothetical protein
MTTYSTEKGNKILFYKRPLVFGMRDCRGCNYIEALTNIHTCCDARHFLAVTLFNPGAI